jgi:hypothetical protein
MSRTLVYLNKKLTEEQLSSFILGNYQNYKDPEFIKKFQYYV